MQKVTLMYTGRSACTIVFPLIFGMLLLVGCNQQSSTPQQEQLSLDDRYTGPYLTHLQLDSTRLVATELMNGLDIPWNIEAGADGWIWINEHRGVISRVHPDTGEHQVLHEVSDVYHERTRGLNSMTLHPDFESIPHLFIHYVYKNDEGDDATRIVRYTFDGEELTERTVILDDLDGANGHNGSRMMIGPDGNLWLGTGDAHRGDLAQNPDYYQGKVLRMNLDGSIPEDNPYGNRVWSRGHRNIQGITHGRGNIYASEHGPESFDEVNLIREGGNYGWPDVVGPCELDRNRDYCRDSLITDALVFFDPAVPPSGIAYYDRDEIPEWSNSLLLATLRVQTLRVLNLNESGESVDDISIYFQQYFGRLRDVIVGHDGRIYISTANMDWYRESVPEIHDPALVENGDRIIVLEPETDELLAKLNRRGDEIVIRAEDETPLYLGRDDPDTAETVGEHLYLAQCSSCHRPDGSGLEGMAPDLTQLMENSESRQRALQLTLGGSGVLDPSGAGRNYEWDMPSFGHLNDGEIADILNWISSEFAQSDHRFTEEDIELVRSSLQSGREQ